MSVIKQTDGSEKRSPKAPRLTLGSDVYIMLGGADVLYPLGYDEYEICEKRVRFFGKGRSVVISPALGEYGCEFHGRSAANAIKQECESIDAVRKFIKEVSRM